MASKSALEGLIKSLALEYEMWGIAFNAISISQNKLFHAREEHFLPPKKMRHQMLDYDLSTPYPIKIKEAIEFLISMSTSPLNGQTIDIEALQESKELLDKSNQLNKLTA